VYMMTQERWRPSVSTFKFYTSNVYITSLGGDMHSHERLPHRVSEKAVKTVFIILSKFN